VAVLELACVDSCTRIRTEGDYSNCRKPTHLVDTFQAFLGDWCSRAEAVEVAGQGIQDGVGHTATKKGIIIRKCEVFSSVCKCQLEQKSRGELVPVQTDTVTWHLSPTLLCFRI